MKTAVTILLAILITGFTSDLDAQSLRDRLQKNQNTEQDSVRSTNEGVKQVVRGEVNRRLDRIFGTQEESPANTGSQPVSSQPTTAEPSKTSSETSSNTSSTSPGPDMNALMSAMGMTTGTAKVKSSYDFDAYIEMLVSNYEKDGNLDNSLIYKTFIDEQSLDYGIQFADEDQQDISLMIFDTENSVMLTLVDSDGEKSGMAIAFSPDQMEAIEQEMDVEEIEEDPYKMYKTGKTRKILGYSCDEYRIDDESSIVTMWITQELNKKIKKEYLNSSSFSGLFMHAYYSDGFVLEYIIESKETKEKTVMTITDIDLNKHTSINTGGYSIMNLGSMPGEEEE